MTTMKLIYSSKNNNPSAKAFITKYVKFPDSFNVNIYAQDEVYLHGLKHLKNEDLALVLYFKYGAQIMDAVRQIAAWKFGGLGTISTFLDFACGYGRFGRFLVKELPAERVWASDIYANAVGFQQEQFGVNGIPSVSDPERFASDQEFDFILVASLFSHLPEKSFGTWLAKLHSLLTLDGILVFSVHDEYILGNTPMPSAGFYFNSNSESKYLGSDEYGTMVVTESFMREAINRVIGHDWPYCRIKRGLCNFQDLYLITKNPGEDFAGLNFRLGPEGHLDVCSLTQAGELNCAGWAGDPTEGVNIGEIQVIINDKIVQRCMPVLERPDVVSVLRQPKYSHSGWSCSCQLENQEPFDIMEIKAFSNDGIEGLLHLGALRSSLTLK